MAKKDKKKADRKERIAEKTSRKSAAKEKKVTKKGSAGVEVDPDDMDIDKVLAEYARQVRTLPSRNIFTPFPHFPLPPLPPPIPTKKIKK